MFCGYTRLPSLTAEKKWKAFHRLSLYNFNLYVLQEVYKLWNLSQKKFILRWDLTNIMRRRSDGHISPITLTHSER
jgi:hypothetical protein